LLEAVVVEQIMAVAVALGEFFLALLLYSQILHMWWWLVLGALVMQME
jgi:hypothetical protein